MDPEVKKRLRAAGSWLAKKCEERRSSMFDLVEYLEGVIVVRIEVALHEWKYEADQGIGLLVQNTNEEGRIVTEYYVTTRTYADGSGSAALAIFCALHEVSHLFLKHLKQNKLIFGPGSDPTEQEASYICFVACLLSNQVLDGVFPRTLSTQDFVLIGKTYLSSVLPSEADVISEMKDIQLMLGK